MDDLIYRSQAIEAVAELSDERVMRGPDEPYFVALAEVSDRIEELPAADVRENVRCEWETDSDNLPFCPNCGEIALQRVFVKVPQLIQDVRMVRSNFCPNCGADMRGLTNDE